jgi:hypothetical protein
MKRLGSSLIALGLGLAGFALAADSPKPPAAVPGTNALPTPASIAQIMPHTSPLASSPVALFRQLLNMSPVERESFLTNRPPATRRALADKIKEYQAMDPDARELRLRATELRWQLIPLLRTAPAQRGPQLARVPEDLAPLVHSRLAEWDKLSPALQQEFLADDDSRNYFLRLSATNPPAADPAAEARHQQIAAQFNQIFELTPEEQTNTLKTLSATERAQMEATLQAYGKLTPPQRIQCLRAFAKFAELSQQERKEFLENAGRWAQMSPKERQTWRDLVARVPSWPPLPPILPPMPPRVLTQKIHPVVATNQN